MHIELLILRLLHVVGGAMWFGAGFASMIWFSPAITAAGPAAAPAIMAVFQKRRMLQIMPLIALVTVLSGLRLLWIVSNGYSAAYFATPMGHAYAIAGGLGLFAFIFGAFVARRRAMQGKFGAMYAANVMLGLSMFGMAIARYVN